MSDETQAQDVEQAQSAIEVTPGNRLRDTKTGRFVGNLEWQNDRAAAVRAAEAGNEAIRQRSAEQARRFTLQEISALYPDGDLASFEEAWGALTGRLASDAYLTDATLQSRVQAFKAVGEAAGVLGGERQAQGAGNGLNIHVGSELARELLAFVAEAAQSKKEQVIDTEAVRAEWHTETQEAGGQTPSEGS